MEAFFSRMRRQMRLKTMLERRRLEQLETLSWKLERTQSTDSSLNGKAVSGWLESGEAVCGMRMAG